MTRKLTELDKQALSAFADTEDDFGYLSFRAIAERSGMEQGHVRRQVRRLARLGLTQFKSGLFTEDGAPYGSGYAITTEGRAALTSGGGDE